jgi:hypothetical protein
MKLRFPGWCASVKVCQFAVKHFLKQVPNLNFLGKMRTKPIRHLLSGIPDGNLETSVPEFNAYSIK